MSATKTKTKRAHQGYKWEDVEVLEYKSEGSAPFKDVTRQVLFEDPNLQAQLRYFEVAAGGHTTLEKHQHVHAVLILRGRGRCLVGEEIIEFDQNDLISVPPLTWHQFHAADDGPMGFLCLVSTERDRPILPSEEDLQALRRFKPIADFIRVEG